MAMIVAAGLKLVSGLCVFLFLKEAETSSDSALS